MSTINPNTSKDIDNAFDKLTGFQKEYCIHLRSLIHKALPEVKEDWKWGGPNFDVSGAVCGVLGFKNHISLSFFKGSLMKDPYQLFTQAEDNKSSRSIHFTEETPIDDAKITEYLKEAASLNKEELKAVQKPREVNVPSDLLKALGANSGLRMYFDKLAPSHRREFSEYVTDAKQDETRERRVKKIVDMIIENKKLHEKFAKRKPRK